MWWKVYGLIYILIHLIAVIGGKLVVRGTYPTCIMDGVFNEVG
jgi:hypothetical protein